MNQRDCVYLPPQRSYDRPSPPGTRASQLPRRSLCPARQNTQMPRASRLQDQGKGDGRNTASAVSPKQREGRLHTDHSQEGCEGYLPWSDALKIRRNYGWRCILACGSLFVSAAMLSPRKQAQIAYR